MDSQERFLIELLMLGFGLFIVFMPYIIKDLFITFSNEAAKTNPKIPIDPDERIKWLSRALLRSMWIYFAILAVFMIYDTVVLIARLFS